MLWIVEASPNATLLIYLPDGNKTFDPLIIGLHLQYNINTRRTEVFV